MLNTILTKMKSFAKDETGASAIEYAVMAALLVGIILVAVTFLGSSTDGSSEAGLNKAFSDIGSTLGTPDTTGG